MGRDERFAQARELRMRQSAHAKTLEQSARSAASQQPILDRFGVPIEPNDLVLYAAPQDMVFRVREVNRVLPPGAPPGMAILVIEVAAPLQVIAGQPVGNLVVVGTAGQIGAAAPAPSDEEIPPADGPVNPAGLVDEGGRPLSAD